MSKYQAYCGGPVNGQILGIMQAIYSHHVPIMDYTRSSETIAVDEKEQADVWHWNYNHEPNDWRDVYNPDSRPTIAECMWDELDAGYKKLTESGPNMPVEDFNVLKGYLRGIAWSIKEVMSPNFVSADQVVREAMVRYEHFKAGEEYETVGLRSRRLEMVGPGGSRFVKPEPETAKAPATHNLAPEVVEKLKQARASGMFSDEDLMGMYKLTKAQLRSL